MKLRFLLLFLVLQGSLAMGQDQSFPHARPLGFMLPDYYNRATVPFEIYNNLIVIDVLLNRSLPLKFILDTGVRTTVLTEKTLSDLLNMEYARKITIPGVGGQKLVDAFVVNDVSLNIGAVQGEGHALLVLEKDLLQLKNYLGVSVHGILGYELFSRFIVDIDYAKKIIHFYRHEDFKEKKKKKYTAFDITIEDTKPFLHANLVIRDSTGVQEGKFLVDTGSSHNLLLDSRTSNIFYCPKPNLETNLGRGLGGNIEGRVARINHLDFGPFTFEEVIATYPYETSYDVDYSSNERNGTFGGGLMSRFNTIYDYANGKLYLKKRRGAYKEPFEFNLSGLVVKATGVYLREFEVDNVRPNSSAEQVGLKKGDKIVAVNGTKAHTLTLDEVLGKINVKANHRVRLDIRRNGERMVFTFKLRRLI